MVYESTYQELCSKPLKESFISMHDGDCYKITCASKVQQMMLERNIKNAEQLLTREFGRFQLACKRSKRNPLILYVFHLE